VPWSTRAARQLPCSCSDARVTPHAEWDYCADCECFQHACNHTCGAYWQTAGPATSTRVLRVHGTFLCCVPPSCARYWSIIKYFHLKLGSPVPALWVSGSNNVSNISHRPAPAAAFTPWKFACIPCAHCCEAENALGGSRTEWAQMCPWLLFDHACGDPISYVIAQVTKGSAEAISSALPRAFTQWWSRLPDTKAACLSAGPCSRSCTT
jgi:hypothetical protein